MEVVRRGLDDAQSKNGFDVTMDSEALDLIAHLSEGYPHFIQQFSYCAFDDDTDNRIDGEDVINSLYRENRALDQLGREILPRIIL